MPNDTALLIIDVQQGLFKGDKPVVDGDGLIKRINVLTAKARAAEIPVIYVQDLDVQGEDGDFDLHPGLEPQDGDQRVHKKYTDSFYETPLQGHLEAMGVKNLLIAGCKTNACVDMACRRAVAMGYNVTLVADCHSTNDNSFMPGAKSIEYYNVILDGIGAEDGFGNGEREIRVLGCEDLGL